MINYETFTASPDGYALEGKLFRFSINILEDYLGYLEEDGVRLSEQTSIENLDDHTKALQHLKKIRPYYVATYQARFGDLRHLVTEELIYCLHLVQSVLYYNDYIKSTTYDVYSEKDKSLIENGVSYEDAVYDSLKTHFFEPESDSWVWPSGTTLENYHDSPHLFMTKNLRSFVNRTGVGDSLLAKMNEDFYTQLNTLHHRFLEQNQNHVEFRRIMDHIKEEQD
jgi:hypothetical protein